jgi:hypothetical protein
VGKAEESKPIERSRRRWKDNTKMNFQEIGWSMDIGLAQDREKRRSLENVIINHRIH